MFGNRILDFYILLWTHVQPTAQGADNLSCVWLVKTCSFGISGRRSLNGKCLMNHVMINCKEETFCFQGLGLLLPLKKH